MSCFIFKPDGIGDFILATGAIRLLANQFGEKNLTIAILSFLAPLVHDQFPEAKIISLPLRRKRKLFNLFLLNSFIIFPTIIKLLSCSTVDYAISFRHMRCSISSILFYALSARKRFLIKNRLLVHGTKKRTFLENISLKFFSPQIYEYPVSPFPREIEAHRLLVSSVLNRTVMREEILPVLLIKKEIIKKNIWICSPFSEGNGKDMPFELWGEIFLKLSQAMELKHIIFIGSMIQKQKLEEFRSYLITVLQKERRKIKKLSKLNDLFEVFIPFSLQEFIALLPTADLILTVDTATAHAAIALNLPTVILYSGQHHGDYAPWTSNQYQYWLMPEQIVNGKPWYKYLSVDLVVNRIFDLSKL